MVENLKTVEMTIVQRIDSKLLDYILQTTKALQKFTYRLKYPTQRASYIPVSPSDLPLHPTLNIPPMLTALTIDFHPLLHTQLLSLLAILSP